MCKQFNSLLRMAIIATLLFVFNTANATDVRGRVIDSEGQAVAHVSVVAQSQDSVFIAATLTDSLGRFMLKGVQPPCRLVFQHLSYRVHTLDCSMDDVGDVRLTEAEHILDGVTVNTVRPQVSVVDGRLGYNLDALTTGRAVSNVWDALKYVPGVNTESGSLSIVGTSSTTVIIDNRVQNMTDGQLKTLLTTLPTDRVERVEVLYSAPPQLHVRGAAVNIILKKSAQRTFQAEAKGSWTNCYYDSFGFGGNFRLSSPRHTIDVIYEANKADDYSELAIDSHHKLDNEVYDIAQTGLNHFSGTSHIARIDYSYNLTKRSKATFTYNAQLSPANRSKGVTEGTLLHSCKDWHERNYLHNFMAGLTTGFGLTVDASLTRYHLASRNHLSTDGSAEQTVIVTNSGQDVTRLRLSADQEHALSHRWKLSYGASFAYAKDDDSQFYHDVMGAVSTHDTESSMTERTFEAYGGLSKNFSKRLTASASLAFEHYELASFSRNALYPRFSMTFKPDDKNVLMLSLSTDKRYPNYWAMQDATTHLDGYSEVQGTPELRPSRTQNLSATWITSRRYVLTAFYNNAKDYFTQLAWQSNERLALVYKMLNWDFNRQIGLMFTAPFRSFKRLDTRVTLLTLRLHEKCSNFYDISFNRSKYVGKLTFDNSLRLCKGLTAGVIFSYTTPMIQGIYDLTETFMLNASLKYVFMHNHATLTARLDNLFDDRGRPRVHVDYCGQSLRMNTGRHSRAFTMTFSYRLGDYKDVRRKEADTSRLGH